jgi:AcrR family transcriptional regulator
VTVSARARAAGPGTHPTRIRMIEVAERLFAERGIDAVSSAEIIEAAGQRNKNAVHYHFGGKEGLVTAIAEYRSASLNARRSGLLDELRAHGREGDAFAVCSTLLVPLAELLDDPGNNFLGFLARYHLDRSRRRLVRSVDPRLIASYRDAARLLRGMSDLGRTDFDARYALVLDMIFTALAGREADERSGDVGRAGRAVLVRNLIGSAVGALRGPTG